VTDDLFDNSDQLDLFDNSYQTPVAVGTARVVGGRYRLPDPDPLNGNPAYKRIKKWVGTDSATSWMRATRLASVIADSYALNAWRNRMAVYGVAQQPALIATLQRLDVREDRAEIEAIVEDAIRLADGIDRAALGTRIHLATEQIDRRIQHMENGGNPTDIEFTEPDLIHHVANWKTALENAGIEIIAIEDIIAVADLGVAGRLDRIGLTTEPLHISIGTGDNFRIIIVPADTYIIVDLKTGKSLEHAWHEVAVQLALYANHTHRFREGAEGDDLKWYAPLLNMEKRVALVVHIPAMEGGAYLYGVDIEKGWHGAKLARQVADWHAMTGFSGVAELA
jgi:hypothetical protein